LRFTLRSDSEEINMRTLSFFAFVVAVGTLGCLPDQTLPSDGGAGGGGGSGGVTYTRDVKPIFMAKCAPCHTTDGLGQHNLGTTYADVHKPAVSLDAPAGCFFDGFDRTMPKTMGECALASIMEGWMPMAMGCFNTPRPAGCVTVAEQNVIAAWVAAGMPE
jgi:hypothetical protein